MILVLYLFYVPKCCNIGIFQTDKTKSHRGVDKILLWEYDISITLWKYGDDRMKKLTIFHGSPEIIEKPQFGKGKTYNDYGRGFYCTEHIELAKEWACTEDVDGFVNKYEIDFLLVRNKKLCPIEVKSSGYKNHKSFDMFAGKYQAKVQERYMICAKDLSVEENIIRIPLYMTMCL